MVESDPLAFSTTPPPKSPCMENNERGKVTRNARHTGANKQAADQEKRRDYDAAKPRRSSVKREEKRIQINEPFLRGKFDGYKWESKY